MTDTEPKIGLALGGGGARGYAHIPVLEALDDLGIRPYCIAGTSIGAIVAATYASGMTGAQIRSRVEQATIWRKDTLRDLAAKKNLWSWFHLMVPEFRRGGFIHSGKMIGRIVSDLGVGTFEELAIPLKLVATDVWRCEEAVFASGELDPAIRASMAIPGVFAPVEHDGRLLVDGSILSLVPVEHLETICDLTIAVNVSHVEPKDASSPGLRTMDLLQRTTDLALDAAVEAALARRRPDIYITPRVGHFPVGDFGRAESILRAADPIREELKDELRALLGKEAGKPVGMRRLPAPATETEAAKSEEGEQG